MGSPAVFVWKRAVLGRVVVDQGSLVVAPLVGEDAALCVCVHVYVGVWVWV
jgi:hypothetical protein